jgi:hypothetical protein
MSYTCIIYLDPIKLDRYITRENEYAIIANAKWNIFQVSRGQITFLMKLNVLAALYSVCKQRWIYL